MGITRRKALQVILSARSLDLIPLGVITFQLITWAVLSSALLNWENFSLVRIFLPLLVILLFFGTLIVLSPILKYSEGRLKPVLTVILLTSIALSYAIISRDLNMMISSLGNFGCSRQVLIYNPKILTGGSSWGIFSAETEEGRIVRFLVKGKALRELEEIKSAEVTLKPLEVSGGFRDYLILSGVSAELESLKGIERKAEESSIPKLLAHLRGRLGERFEEIGYKEKEILGGLILGWRDISRDLKEIFIRSGLYHLLVASGSNVLIIGFLTFILLPKVIPESWRALLALITMTGYLIVAGPDFPLLRGWLLGVLLLVARYILPFKLNPIRGLLWVWLLISAIIPLSSLSWSFLMSFLASGIVLSLNYDESLVGTLRLSWWIWLAMLPISLLVFKGASLLAPLSNAIAVPVVGFIFPLTLMWLMPLPVIIAEPLGVLLKISVNYLITLAQFFSSAYLRINWDLKLQSLAFMYILGVIWFIWWRSLQSDLRALERIYN